MWEQELSGFFNLTEHYFFHDNKFCSLKWSIFIFYFLDFSTEFESWVMDSSPSNWWKTTCKYLESGILPYSLSKWSNYPFIIFLCPKIEFKQYPWKKPNTLNYPNSIRENLAMSQTFSMFFKNIAKFKNLCFLLHKIFSILVFFTT